MSRIVGVNNVMAHNIGGVEPQVAAGGDAGQAARPQLLHVRVEAVAQPRRGLRTENPSEEGLRRSLPLAPHRV